MSPVRASSADNKNAIHNSVDEVSDETDRQTDWWLVVVSALRLDESTIIIKWR